MPQRLAGLSRPKRTSPFICLQIVDPLLQRLKEKTPPRKCGGAISLVRPADVEQRRLQLEGLVKHRLAALDHNDFGACKLNVRDTRRPI